MKERCVVFVECIVRKAKPGDEQGIIELWRKLCFSQSEIDPCYDKSNNENRTLNREISLESNEMYGFFVAENEGNIVGFIEVRLHNKDFYFYAAPYAYILCFYINSEYRKLSVAKRLQYMAEEWAKGKGVKYIQGDVYSHNAKMYRAIEISGYKAYRTRFVKEL